LLLRQFVVAMMKQPKSKSLNSIQMVHLYDFRFQRRSIYLFELALCFFEFARFVIFLEIDQPSLQKDLHHQTFRLQLVRFMMVG